MLAPDVEEEAVAFDMCWRGAAKATVVAADVVARTLRKYAEVHSERRKSELRGRDDELAKEAEEEAKLSRRAFRMQLALV